MSDCWFIVDVWFVVSWLRLSVVVVVLLFEVVVVMFIELL